MPNLMRFTLSAVAMCALSTGLLYSDAVSAGTDSASLAPATNMYATRGLSQTVSAEPLGEGRLTISTTFTWYKQDVGFPTVLHVPPQDADVVTGILAGSFGVNSYFDVFASAAGFGIFSGDASENGKGSISGGIKGALPLPKLAPLHLGAQLLVIGGISSSQVDSTFIDGYNYFDTRNRYDIVGRIMQSLVFGNDSLGIKCHFNQGCAFQLEGDNRQLLLLGAGIEGIVKPNIVIGLEVNSRTNLDSLNNRTDPLWLTPSVQYKTPYYLNVLLGADISLSGERPTMSKRALEPYRIFGCFDFSFDLLAKKRRAEREKAAQEKADMEKKIRESQAKANMIARKARADSIALAKVRADEQRKADLMAEKARQDSITLADLKQKLDEERSKRSDAEKQLLSTGLLLLDAVYFETGKSQISINSFPYLKIIGKMLTKYPKLQIEVAGHTDNIGKYEKNISLSQARAEAVRRYLIQVAPDLLTRISARGYGPTQPKAPNTTAEGRKMNRRTELQVLNKEALIEYN